MANNRGELSAGSVALAFLSGALIGAAAAFLVAPQPGRESRERILNYARRTGEDLCELTGKATELWEDVFQKGSEFIDEARGAMQEAVEAGRDAMKRERTRRREEASL